MNPLISARLVVLFLAACPVTIFAQFCDDPDLPIAPVQDPAVTGQGEKATQVFIEVEEMPEFPGGHQALMKYLSQRLQYPAGAREEEIQGKVFLTFVVQEDGSLRDVRVLRGVHPLLDREAVRVVRSMPKWRPGSNMGKVCCVQYNLPVNFVLQ